MRRKHHERSSRKQHTPGIKEKKNRVKARNEDQPRKGIYYVGKPNPLRLGFWESM
jgi:hypothetical protein